MCMYIAIFPDVTQKVLYMLNYTYSFGIMYIVILIRALLFCISFNLLAGHLTGCIDYDIVY